MDLWTHCKGSNQIQDLETNVWRIVEAQHVLATRKLVDSVEEHEILEALIENAKPLVISPDLHYLLSTPFRYPPLNHGSRFAKASEPSLWYGSLELETALAESAYYRFFLLSGSIAKLGTVETLHTAFPVKLKTTRGVDLRKPLLSEYEKTISSPLDYTQSQVLGEAMRKEGVEAFIYKTARAKQGSNAGVFTPNAFFSKTLSSSSFQTWRCVCNLSVVEFYPENYSKATRQIFYATQFMVGDQVPFPSN